jgi:hypothetical protein
MVDQVSGTGFDISLMMLNVTERIGVRKVDLIQKFHISLMIHLIVLSNLACIVL